MGDDQQNRAFIPPQLADDIADSVDVNIPQPQSCHFSDCQMRNSRFLTGQAGRSHQPLQKIGAGAGVIG
jgi:hypothetical protein